MKKFLSVLLISVLILSSMVVTVDAATSGTGYLYVNAVQKYSEVQDALTALNKVRKAAGLKPVKLDKELCDLAVQRAAEASVYIDSKHTRPNGTDRGTISKRLEKENWAIGTYMTGTSVIDDVWMTSSGHKKNMLYNKAVSAGIGFISVEGYSPHCILILSSTKVKSEMTTKTGTKTYRARVEVKTDYLKASNFNIVEKNAGEFNMDEPFSNFLITQDIPATVTFDANAGLSHEVKLDPKNFTWTSSNKLIANVTTDGKIMSTYPGTVTITAKLKTSPGTTISRTITIEGNPFGIGFDEYDYDSDPYYPDYFEEDDDSWMFGESKSSTVKSAPKLASAAPAKAAAKKVDLMIMDPEDDKFVSVYYLPTGAYGYGVLDGVNKGDVIPFKASDSEAENEELLSHITLSLDKYGSQKGIEIDNDKHEIRFTDAGLFYVLITCDEAVTVPVNEFMIVASKPLESATLYIDPDNDIQVYSPVDIDCWTHGGSTAERFTYTITDESGNKAAEYYTEDYYEKEWTWVPEELGKYTIEAEVEDTKDNVKVTAAPVTVHVVQAEHPLVMPEEEYIVPDKPGSAILPEGWEFAAEDLDAELADGETREFTAHYNATDSYKFKNLEATVKVTRKICEHPETELRGEVVATCVSDGYSGDTYCKECGMLLEIGEVLEKNPDSHPEDKLITTMKPAEIYNSGHTEHQYCTACETVVKQGEELPAIDSYTMNTTSLVYSPQGRTVNGVFKAGDYTLVKDKDYTVSYSGNKSIGMVTVKYTFKGKYDGTFEDYFDIVKAANTLTVKAKTVKVKYSKLKKKNQTIAAKTAMTVSGNKGNVTYRKTSGNRKITVASNGKITVKKKLKKGTYKVKITVTAAGNAYYNSASKTVTVTIKVK
ncbi:MAG: CAP domain-containing protein [Mogibacterium sp.]|nr:CAP domain-containing protein [Mogibacterium sp.]